MIARAPRKMKGKMTVPTEHQEQTALFRWAEFASGKHPELRLLFSVPNGSNKSIATAMKFKREGLKAGVPDVILPVARGGFHSLFIELKRTKGGVVSDEQKAWHEALTEQGHKVVVARGAQEAIDALTEYLRLPKWKGEK